jgi:hypothetical protein
LYESELCHSPSINFQEKIMKLIYSAPTLVGDVYRFDLCREVILSPAPALSFAFVAYPTGGSLGCDCYRILSIETCVFDRYTYPATDAEVVPKIAATGSKLEDLGWSFTGQINTRDYLIPEPDDRPLPLFETLATADEHLVDIRSMTALEEDQGESLVNVKNRFVKRARDHLGLNGQPKQ